MKGIDLLDLLDCSIWKCSNSTDLDLEEHVNKQLFLLAGLVKTFHGAKPAAVGLLA